MKKLLGILVTALMLLSSTACTHNSKEAAEAYQAAESGDIESALQHADQAYADFGKLGTEDMCRLAATYAVAAITMGNEQAMERFQQCYKTSISQDKQKAEEFYNTLDPQMADGLAIISNLLEGADNYTTPESTPIPESIIEEGIAED